MYVCTTELVFSSLSVFVGISSAIFVGYWWVFVCISSAIFADWFANLSGVWHLFSFRTCRADEDSFTVQEQDRFKLMCKVLADDLVPYLNKCLQVLFPPSQLALVLGVPPAEVNKMVTALELCRVVYIMIDFLFATIWFVTLVCTWKPVVFFNAGRVLCRVYFLLFRNSLKLVYICANKLVSCPLSEFVQGPCMCIWWNYCKTHP